MIALSVPRFAHCDFGLHDRIAFSLECEQLLESTVLEHIDTSGLYRLRLAVDPPSLFVHSGRRTRSVLASSPYVTHDHSVWHQ